MARSAVAEVVVGEGVGFAAVQLDILKSRPVTEGDRRFVYCEPSRETWDSQNEKILLRALFKSRDYYVAKGNIDLDHLTVIGHKIRGINPREWEIGIPLDVQLTPGGLFLKGEIYRGNPKADWFWESLTAQTPPMRWFPSVGGKPLAHRDVYDAGIGKKRRVFTEVLWHNTGFAREPIHHEVPGVSTQCVGSFCKSVMWAEGNRCCDHDACGGTPDTCDVTKAITAGYGTDVASLTGGGALRLQSHAGGVVDPWSRGAKKLLRGECEHAHQETHSIRTLTAHFRDCEGMDDVAARRAALRLAHTVQRSRR